MEFSVYRSPEAQEATHSDVDVSHRGFDETNEDFARITGFHPEGPALLRLAPGKTQSVPSARLLAVSAATASGKVNFVSLRDRRVDVLTSVPNDPFAGDRGHVF